ncbi:HAD family hydrolase [Pseudovibrio brasiliensis]|uniref:HAD family phosphatase n=1 Tax=Pseudovibrio brasiliensis TaxID=1898042 RepID=A0ABX8ASW3_9HYPH|nr:HAD family phosphatase [Pseudovibrio brasiliensis]QUS56709.1 HAD family phosphatase [Pseudovibrio brasiliensis]
MLQLSSPPKLVIFDCDGVLVDSEKIYIRILHQMMQSFGAPLSFQQCWEMFVGKTSRDVNDYLKEQGLTAPDTWTQDFHEQANVAMGQEAQPVEGVKQVVEQLVNAGIPICVGSNGHPKTVRLSLEVTGLLPFFGDNVFTATDVGVPKPAPDLFLHGAKMAGISPEHCVVIEDSATGLKAAANAGMRSFVYSPENIPTPTNLFGAHPFQSMATLPDLLGLVPA